MSKRIKEFLESLESKEAYILDECIVPLKNGTNEDIFNVRLEENGVYFKCGKGMDNIRILKEEDLEPSAIQTIYDILENGNEVMFYDENEIIICYDYIEEETDEIEEEL